MLLKKGSETRQRILTFLEDAFGAGVDAEAKLKALIWEHRSSVNPRGDVTGRDKLAHLDARGLDERATLGALFADIQEAMDAMSRAFLKRRYF